jgi:hypothetical protein
MQSAGYENYKRVIFVSVEGKRQSSTGKEVVVQRKRGKGGA